MVRPRRLSGAALTAVFLLGVFAAIPAAANNTAQPLPFTQNWSNAGLITVANNWSAVPGVIGYRGQDLTTAPGVDPQTVLGESGAYPTLPDAPGPIIPDGAPVVSPDWAAIAGNRDAILAEYQQVFGG